MGCGCRGEAAGKHLQCAIMFAKTKSASIDVMDHITTDPFTACLTCLQEYDGSCWCGVDGLAIVLLIEGEPVQSHACWFT
jgi:hypothetical protein